VFSLDAGCAAPGPVLAPVDQARADGVVEHVGDRSGEVRLVADDPAAEACAEEVAVAAVAVVELERVGAVQELHAGGEVGERGLDDEVVVVAHETQGVDLPGVAADCEEEEAQEAAAILVVAVDRVSVHAAGRDVVDAGWREGATRLAGHSRRR
jgi:hypothetical protein